MVHWTHRASEDLLAIGDYIAADDPVAARDWLEQLRQRAGDAAAAPNAGRIVPELGRADVREVFLRSYRIVYRVSSTGDVTVLTVFEGHMRLGPLNPDASE